MPPIDTLEQVVQSEGYEDKTSLADEFARDAEAKQSFVCGDIGGSRCRVCVDDELVGDVAQSEKTND